VIALAQEIEAETLALAQLQEKRAQIEAEMVTKRTTKKDLEQQQSKLQTDLLNLEKQTLVLRSRKSEISNRLESIKRSLVSSQESLQVLKSEEQTASEAQAGIEKGLEALEEQQREFENQRKVIQENQLEIKRALEENSALLNKLNLDKNKLTNQLQLLRQSQESLAGYSDGAKSLMKNARVRQYGRTITDLAAKLDVPEK